MKMIETCEAFLVAVYKYCSGSICLMFLFCMVLAGPVLSQDLTTKLTRPEKVAEAQLEDEIDQSKMTDAEIDKIKNIEEVKAYLKLLTAQVLIKQKAKEKAKKDK